MNNVWIDADLTKDTDTDGNIANDTDSLNPTTSYGIKKGTTVYHLDIGPFDTLFTKKVRLFAEDGNGNISSKDLTLTVYPPVPEIQSLSGVIVSGDLSEVLAGEPIDIFRLRNGTLSRIEPAKIDGVKTVESGVFTIPTKNTNGIILTESGKTIATIDERTGKISLEDTSFHIAVVPASESSPLLIQVLSPTKNLVFSESIDISTVPNIELLSSLDFATGA